MRLLGLMVVVGTVAVTAPVVRAADPAPGAPAAAAPSPAPEALGLQVPKDEKAMLERLHRANQLEIQLARLAEDTTRNPQVKAYAEMIVHDHTNADGQVLTFAEMENLRLEDPKPMDDTEKAMMSLDKETLETLKVLRGQAFDEQFLTTMVHQHDVAIALALAGEQQFAGTRLAPLLHGLLPTLRGHRGRAYNLLGDATPKLTVG